MQPLNSVEGDDFGFDGTTTGLCDSLIIMTDEYNKLDKTFNITPEVVEEEKPKSIGKRKNLIDLH